MGGYYFLIPALPPLVLGHPPEISLNQLKEMLALNLSEKDREKVRELFILLDLADIRAFWMNHPLSGQGSFEGKDLEEALLTGEGLPSFVVDFLEKYPETAERLRFFSSLYASLYREPKEGFLGRYFSFERELRLCLVALRAKRFGKDLVKEFQFEDPTDPLVASLLAQKDSPETSLPFEYEDLKSLFMENLSNPASLHSALLKYRFAKIEEMEEPHDFGIDRILAYLARFLLVDAERKLDRERGNIAVEQLSRYG